jgi:cytochrome bd-type quinol oxidase subunit 2
MSVWMTFLADASGAISSGAKSACGTSCGSSDLTKIFTGLANTLVFIVGAVSVIMIIIGGLRYVIANGDSKAIGDAKNTILYAVIGVIVAISAFAIISFVTKNIK